jgi:hypothetical protein
MWKTEERIRMLYRASLSQTNKPPPELSDPWNVIHTYSVQRDCKLIVLTAKGPG